MQLLKEKKEWLTQERLRSWLPVIAWCAWIFLLSSSDVPVRVAQHYWKFSVKADIPGHMGEFVILGFLLTRSLFAEWKSDSGIPLALQVLLFGGLYAASDEFHQYFVPGRSCALDDFLWDLASLILGMYLYQCYLKAVLLVRQKAAV